MHLAAKSHGLLPVLNAAAHVVESTQKIHSSHLEKKEKAFLKSCQVEGSCRGCTADSAVRCEGHHDEFCALRYLVTNTRVQTWRLHHS